LPHPPLAKIFRLIEGIGTRGIEGLNGNRVQGTQTEKGTLKVLKKKKKKNNVEKKIHN